MKKQILEDMASSVGQDALEAGTRVIKSSAYWLTAPIIGMLSEEAKSQIYSGKNNLVKKATHISLAPELLSYSVVLDEAGFHRLAIGALFYGLLETGCRLVAGWPGRNGDLARRFFFDYERGSSPSYEGTLWGYLPSKVIEYIGDKYDSAKNKLEGERK